MCTFSYTFIIYSGGSRISPRWRRQPSKRGRQHTILPKFPPKLHEIKRIWTPGGHVLRVPLRSATDILTILFFSTAIIPDTSHVNNRRLLARGRLDKMPQIRNSLFWGSCFHGTYDANWSHLMLNFSDTRPYVPATKVCLE